LSAAARPFVRDPLTWLAYAMLAGLSYQQGILGPLMPFLRQSLNLTYTLGGVLVTAVALGMMLAGLSGGWIARRWGRRAMFWGGGLGFVAGSFGLALSPSFPLAFGSVLFTAFASSLTIAMINALLSDRHGEQRAIALTEANVAAALSASLAPACIGLFQRAGLGWQWALFLTAVIMLVIASRFWRVPIPEPTLQAGVSAEARRLPPAYWAYWAVAICVISLEWCYVVWGADFLEQAAGFSKVDATTAMGVFFAAMVVGRALGSALARRWPAAVLLPLSLGVTLLGFPFFWLARSAALTLAGLFVAGLGVASLFPLTVSLAVGLTPGQANTASVRLSLAVGVAIFIAPLLLGGLADAVTLQAAYAIVPALGALTGAILYFNYRRGWRR
jgi:predicted MFS family arabinose efflux permease